MHQRVRHWFDFRHWSVWVIGVGIPVAIFAAAGTSRPAPADTTSRPTASQPATGTQLVAVVLVAEACAYSQRPDVMAGIRDILVATAALAGERNEPFLTIGISVDPNPRVGFQFLDRLFEFNEYMTGNGWTGVGALRYLWQDFPGTPAIPQIVILRRELVRTDEPEPSEDAHRRYLLENERVVHRIFGAEEILGFHVPQLRRALAAAAASG